MGCPPPCPGTVTGTGPLDAGAVLAGCFCRSSTLPDEAALRVARTASESDVTMKIAAAMVVAFESTVADPRGPLLPTKLSRV